LSKSRQEQRYNYKCNFYYVIVWIDVKKAAL
jgi:hypothetical protein